MKTEKAALAKFQSPLLVEHILKNPRFLESPVQQGVAVVFLDLSGFTGVAEVLGPLWTRDLLAAFQALIESVALAHGGFVVSFMGDGAMIVFGLPEPRPDDASRALSRSLACAKPSRGGSPRCRRSPVTGFARGSAGISVRPWSRCSDPRTIGMWRRPAIR